jgi:hypothetical protein
MAREANQIRRDIESTRQEIDEHLRDLGGQVRTQLNVEGQARRNLPQVLAGAAIFGLAAGILFGSRGGRSREARMLSREQARLARQVKRLARERGRVQGAVTMAELDEKGYASDIP